MLRNLLTNAFRHGGDIVEVRIAFHDGSAQISVADNGAGIPEAIRHRVFEPYEHGVHNRSQRGDVSHLVNSLG